MWDTAKSQVSFDDRTLALLLKIVYALRRLKRVAVKCYAYVGHSEEEVMILRRHRDEKLRAAFERDFRPCAPGIGFEVSTTWKVW